MMGSILNNIGNFLGSNNQGAQNPPALSGDTSAMAVNPDTNTFAQLGDQLNNVAQGNKNFDFKSLLQALAPQKISRRKFADLTGEDKKDFLFNLGQNIIQNSTNNPGRFGLGTILGKSLGDTSNQDLTNQQNRQNQLADLMRYTTAFAPQVGTGQLGVEQLGLARNNMNFDQDYKNRALADMMNYRNGLLDINKIKADAYATRGPRTAAGISAIKPISASMQSGLNKALNTALGIDKDSTKFDEGQYTQLSSDAADLLVSGEARSPAEAVNKIMQKYGGLDNVEESGNWNPFADNKRKFKNFGPMNNTISNPSNPLNLSNPDLSTTDPLGLR